ncbi:DUF4433 domain-containing protein [Bacteroides sp. OttesenSCG-928-D19]|nr:DUF4433 domain-containing protein [Bacteroides sp. OttesenSCG-928-N06]MDL2305108.1 DUF4433 domain-containing protein [Bacteroides sp. OttesenSCG-928-D19]
MPLTPFKYIYRLVHCQNVEHILNYGLCTQYYYANPDFTPIGHIQLIKDRNDKSVIDPPGGTLGEYIPFYFAGHSPMLLKICTAHGGQKKYLQSELVYIRCELKDIFASELHWFFTDGNAKTIISSYYNSQDDLDKLDWETIASKEWSNKYGPDKQRKKMAEFLIKDHIPVKYIESIITKSEKTQEHIRSLISKLNLNIPVYVDKKNILYYPEYD